MLAQLVASMARSRRYTRLFVYLAPIIARRRLPQPRAQQPRRQVPRHQQPRRPAQLQAQQPQQQLHHRHAVSAITLGMVLGGQIRAIHALQDVAALGLQAILDRMWGKLFLLIATHHDGAVNGRYCDPYNRGTNDD